MKLEIISFSEEVWNLKLIKSDNFVLLIIEITLKHNVELLTIYEPVNLFL